MNTYLRAAGFSKYTSKSQIQELLDLAAKNPDSQSALVSSAPDTYVELIKYFGKNIGILWHGTVSEGEPDYEYFTPFFIGGHAFIREGFNAEKRIMNHSYTGVVEDLRVGVSVIFYIINDLDFLEWEENKELDYKRVPISLSGLSISGNVILPISMNEDDIIRKKKEINHRVKLINEARNGDEKAIESLTLEDMDTYTKISKRIINEDIFSIVNTSFMPFGLECDQYSVVGDILKVEETKNIVTEEEIWLLMIDVNGLVIDIAINKLDLIGEPVPGRRFKGSIWLQGYILKEQKVKDKVNS